MLYLVGFFLLFIIILIVITITVFKKAKPQICEIDPQQKKDKTVTLDDLLKTLKTEKKELSKIEEALNVMQKKFPFPENEKDANKHFEFVYFFAKNPLPGAKLIVKMQKDLTLVNSKYSKQIEEFQMRGVEARKK